MKTKNISFIWILLVIFSISCISALESDWINGFNSRTGEVREGGNIPSNYSGEIKCESSSCSFTIDGKSIGFAYKTAEDQVNNVRAILSSNLSSSVSYVSTLYFALSSQNYATWGNASLPCADCIFFPGDYNGDGTSDFFGLSNAEKKAYILLSPFNAGWIDVPFSICPEGEDCSFLPISGDFDGDKKTEFIAYNPSSGDIFWLLSSQNYLAWGNGSIPCKNCTIISGNYNGDGVSDFVAYNQESKTIHFALSPNWGEWQSGEIPCANCTFFPGDYNGDGTSDFLGLSNAEKKMYLLLSPFTEGWSNFPVSLCPEGENCNILPVSGNFDGDKQTDILAYNPSSGVIYFSLSSSGYSNLDKISTLCKNCIAIPGDYDGDGISDLVLYTVQTEEQIPIPPGGKNEKDISKYSGKKSFLISDANWKDILQWVSAITWTGDETWCQRGYNTAQNVCTYPALIFHKENSGFDIDSSIYFMQQYAPDKLTLIGDTPQELDNLLVAQPELGAGISESNINRVNSASYLSYWEHFDDVVYVQDDYELALVASTYASLINVPLIITGTKWDTAEVFENRNITCIGNVNPVGAACMSRYNLSELQKRYIDLTHTDKVILTNPNDLDIIVTSSFSPAKSSNPIYDLYGKTSLIAPFLASAKHEIILTTRENSNSEKIRSDLKDNIQTLMSYVIPYGSNTNLGSYGYLTIIASGDAIPFREKLYSEDIYRSLDQTKYANIFKANGYYDGYPDLFTGRIQGITVSDVSSYLARDIFYNQLVRANKLEFFASSFDYMISYANLWASKFRVIGYNSHCSIIPTTSSGVNFDCDINSNNWAELYKNNEFVLYMGHGLSNWNGIFSKDIPLLSNSMIFNDACSTCSTYDNSSFCNIAIRRGALSHSGAVALAFVGNLIYKKTIEGIYKENLTLGESFTKAYSSDMYTGMTNLLGDPTLKINPQHNLEEELPWY